MSEPLTRKQAEEKINAVAISGDNYHADEVLDALDAERARADEYKKGMDTNLAASLDLLDKCEAAEARADQAEAELRAQNSESAQRTAVYFKNKVEQLRGPCYCDPPGSGEEFCHETCMQKARADRLEALTGEAQGMALRLQIERDRLEAECAEARWLLQNIPDEATSSPEEDAAWTARRNAFLESASGQSLLDVVGAAEKAEGLLARLAEKSASETRYGLAAEARVYLSAALSRWKGERG